MTDLTDIALTTLDGRPTTLGQLADGAVLVVNVASKCGLTPQYTALERLAKDYRDRGLTVIGVPCNQFMGQEPGSADEIAEFCKTTYGVTFPLLAKTDVNGDDRHPLYADLIGSHPETDVNNGGGMEDRLRDFGHTRVDPTDVLWNFEKFLIGKEGDVVARFAPDVTPNDERLKAMIEADLSS